MPWQPSRSLPGCAGARGLAQAYTSNVNVPGVQVKTYGPVPQPKKQVTYSGPSYPAGSVDVNVPGPAYPGVHVNVPGVRVLAMQNQAPLLDCWPD